MKKVSRFSGSSLVLFGGMMLLNDLTKPRIGGLHGSDIMNLTGCGACLGVGMVGLLGRLKWWDD
jgi:hypothetical protein